MRTAPQLDECERLRAELLRLDAAREERRRALPAEGSAEWLFGPFARQAVAEGDPLAGLSDDQLRQLEVARAARPYGEAVIVALTAALSETAKTYRAQLLDRARRYLADAEADLGRHEGDEVREQIAAKAQEETERVNALLTPEHGIVPGWKPKARVAWEGERDRLNARVMSLNGVLAAWAGLDPNTPKGVGDLLSGSRDGDPLARFATPEKTP